MPISRNTSTAPEAAAIDEAARVYDKAEAAFNRAREELHRRIVAAVRVGVSRAEAARRSGYTREYVSGLVKAAEEKADRT